MIKLKIVKMMMKFNGVNRLDYKLRLQPKTPLNYTSQ